jgi:hypothetical protein
VSHDFYDLCEIIKVLEKVVKEETGIVVGNPNQFYPKIFASLGFLKKNERNYDTQGVRRNTNLWNFPLKKIQSFVQTT